MKKTILLASIFAITAAWPTFAQTPTAPITPVMSQQVAPTPFELWREGKYDQAMAAGEAAKTPEGLSVAARAAVSDMSLRIPPCLDCETRAEAIVRKAMAADPKAVLPKIYLAAVLGYEGRLVGLMQAQSKGFADQSKKALQDGLAIDPKDPLLLATMGGWNFEIIRIAGSFIARLTYGATEDEGVKYFDEAMKIAPDELLINYQSALALASVDPDKYHDRIKAALSRAVAAKADSVYYSVSQKRAADLLKLLNSGDSNAFATMLKKYMGIPT
ncbi:MAG TPA: hypothetical protein VK779_07090 [Rhizomicrobium sp.]|jgi:hypothetical protein|nr:hypothetical protein [Rhizomicrobium sp.]